MSVAPGAARRAGGILLAAALLAAGFAAPVRAAEDVVLSIAGKTVHLEPARWEGRTGPVHGVVALRRIPTDADREELRGLGVELHQYLPDNAWFATVDASRVADLLALPWVRSAEPFRPEWKAPPRVVEKPESRLSLLPDERRQVVVYFFPDVPREAAMAVLAGVHAVVVSDTWEDFQRLVVAVDLPAVPVLLARDEVRWLDNGRVPARVANATEGAFHSVDQAQAAPYGLDGTGVRVSVMDADRVQDDHPDFGNRVIVVETFGGGADFHATHVTGTILGSGAGNAEAKGMAPGAKSWNWTFEVADVFQPKYFGLAQYLISVDSNSWGIPMGWEYGYYGWLWYTNIEDFGAYSSLCGDLDGLARNTGVLFNFAAGNHWTDDGYDGYGYYDGYVGHYDVDFATWSYSWHTGYHPPDGDAYRYGNLEPTASLKNGLSVGAVDLDGYSALFSSIGPAKDGRLKPDVTAVGVDLLSTIPTNKYGTSSGTSMATPLVTGIAALVIEAWKSSHSGDQPRLDVLKGLLLHSTFDLGNPGPDYTFGFGAIDARAACATALAEDGSGAPRLRTATLSQGQSVEYLLDVTGDPADLRVTLCWTDPPGNPAAQKALVNDLDLVLEDPSGGLHHPWILSPSKPYEDATRGANHLDNVESAEVASPATGIWKARVSGYAVASGTQPFAIWFSHPRHNAPPVADAGPDRIVPATSPAGATVILSGAASYDGNQDENLSYLWDTDGDGDFHDAGGSQYGSNIGVPMAVGNHSVGLMVEDAYGETDTDTALITVSNGPPVAILPADLVFRADDPEGASVALDTSLCTDPQTKADIVAAAWDLDGDGEFDDASGLSITRRFPMGDTPVGLRVTDTKGSNGSTTTTLTVRGPEYVLGPGGSFKGSIAFASDTDSFFLDGVKGAVATVTLKSKTSVTLGVQAPSGASIASLTTKFSAVEKATLNLPEDGWYWLEAVPGTGTVGAYSFSVKVKNPKPAFKGGISLAAAHPVEEWTLDLLTGSTLVMKGKGVGAARVELRGPDGSLVGGGAALGKTAFGPVTATGAYRLRVIADDASGYGYYGVVWKAKLPKGRTKIREGK